MFFFSDSQVFQEFFFDVSIRHQLFVATYSIHEKCTFAPVLNPISIYILLQHIFFDESVVVGICCISIFLFISVLKDCYNLILITCLCVELF